MTMELGEIVPAGCELLAFGEPVHAEPAFRHRRNAMLAELAGRGFRSIVLEVDRVAALVVDDYVREGVGELESVLAAGFSHGWGAFAGNRELVVWLREYNSTRDAPDRIAFHGFDAPMENMSAPSPRGFLRYTREYLGLDPDLPGGPDERWSRTEAVLDPAQSPGRSAEAVRLRLTADELWIELHRRAPALMAATSREAWLRARTWLTAGIGLLRYHRACAEPEEPGSARISRLLAVRDVLMAENLLDLRHIAAPALVCGHNSHLRRGASRWVLGDLDLSWAGAGSIVAPLLGPRYTVVAGSLGSSAAIGLGVPAPDTYEGRLAPGLTPAGEVAPAGVRGDVEPRQGYQPLDADTVAGVDAVWHIPAA
ncbi:erythromycin esterase family protein [Dactylosporangium matsuzakiense]|uniref:Erythromycin esterase n=1 Tax=Dactylosporangium matsuzakiense TaxID=53360 RepID=A0A9W6KI02_9ACTN|nr:erythromycin esterase family protein [Dactylosporangium matsuzakiense]UWZ48307.1 erythromycin esterase family protein [Dactylosporangium matsuzakiense]GLL01548.1 erythromycin esterase [Dactylosporangium matsuzakiense]